MAKISSFDIFDTVLTRKVGSPCSCFLLLGRKLKKYNLINCSVESFARVREQAEWRAFHNAGGLDSDVSLDSIYKELGFMLHLSEEQLEPLKRLEKQLEIELLQPIPKTVDIIQQVRAQQHKVAFISDMYLENDFIRERLESFGLIQAEDSFYLSKDHKKAKVSGKLYHEVTRAEGVAPQDIIHCGNHNWSDVGAAKSAGLQVRPFLEGNLNRYEKLMESHAWMTEGLASAMAGASRLTRLSFHGEPARENALREVAAGVAGPTLVGFNLWVIRRIKALGIKRLYFLARDGQILIEIFRRLMEKLDVDCEICYLYGSRQAWLLPSLTEITPEKLEKIFPLKYDVSYLSIKILFARFCISPDEVAQHLEKVGFSSQDWHRNLTDDERRKLHEHILADQALQQIILAKAAEKREVLLQYLDQVQLTSGDKVGVVDLGTGATLHDALSSVLETRGLEPPTSFYLGLRNNVRASKYGLPEPYMFDDRLKLGFSDAKGLVTFLETICSADHGSVVDYTYRDGTVVPIFTEESNQAVMKWGYTTVRETILAFTNHLLLDQSLVEVWADVRLMTEELVTLFWTSPTREEAQAWGCFPFEDGWGTESVSLTLAAPYSAIDILRLWKRLYKNGAIYLDRHWWHEGATSMTSPALKAIFEGGGKVILTVRKKLLRRS